MLPATPNPCPTLTEGRALGAQEHRGFVAAWNWMVSVLKAAVKYFVLAVNGRTGEIEIVGGTGIDVATDGNTVTISVGDDGDTDSGDTGSGGGGAGSGRGGRGAGGRIIPRPPPEAPSTPTLPAIDPTDSTDSGGGGGGSTDSGGGGCNGFSDDVGNGFGDGGMDNIGDSCSELNGW